MSQPHPGDTGVSDGVHIWKTLGYRFAESADDRITIEWDAAPAYAFPNGGRTIVHGGMVATLLDTAMGHACLARLGPEETFLTGGPPRRLLPRGHAEHPARRGGGQAPIPTSHVLRSLALRRGGRASRVGSLHADREERRVKAIVIEQTGGPEQLNLRDVPDPDTSGGQTLLHVRAAGVNFLDLLVRQGNYAQAPELPTIPGVEAAGETEDGRRVMALLTGSGYAERVAVDSDRLFQLPDGASFAEGASFLLTFLPRGSR